jgi:hypothetical protein
MRGKWVILRETRRNQLGNAHLRQKTRFPAPEKPDWEPENVDRVAKSLEDVPENL